MKRALAVIAGAVVFAGLVPRPPAAIDVQGTSSSRELSRLAAGRAAR